MTNKSRYNQNIINITICKYSIHVRVKRSILLTPIPNTQYLN